MQAASNGPPVGRDMQVLQFFGGLGIEAVAFCTLAVAVPALWSALGGRAALWVLGAALAVLANDGIKELLAPTAAAIGTAEPNFPSGHVVYAAAVGGSLAWLAWRRKQWEVVAVCGLVVAAMGPAPDPLGFPRRQRCRSRLPLRRGLAAGPRRGVRSLARPGSGARRMSALARQRSCLAGHGT